jgi:hypothetical protein
LRTHRTRRHPIPFHCQCREVDARLDLGQRITECINLPAVRIGSKQVGLDRGKSRTRKFGQWDK